VLTNYYWPGNIRELKNIVERIAVITKANVVSVEDIPEYIIKSGLNLNIQDYRKTLFENNGNLKDILWKVEKDIIEDTLKNFKGNKAKTAEKLGIPKMTLYRKLKKI
jgi:DNA-binding NtrC family response regulator